LRAYVGHAISATVVAECVKQSGADTQPFQVVAHTDSLELKHWLGASELAFEHARENVTGEALSIASGILRMQRGLMKRGVETSLEVRASRPALGNGVDGDYFAQIFAFQPAYRQLSRGNCIHDCLLSFCASIRYQPDA
jgi:hypothetical protein